MFTDRKERRRFLRYPKWIAVSSPDFMNNYLKGYLASIPKSDYDSMVRFLKDNITDKLNISEDQFRTLLDQITSDHQAATTSRKVAYNEKPSDTYNDFYSSVYIDLNYLFKIVDLLYNAIDGYTNLSASYLSDIKGEIDKLEIMVREIEAREIYSSNSSVVTETFKNIEQFENYNDSTSYLFCDRDGEQIPPVDIVHNNTEDMITLSISKNIDLLHRSDGKTLGTINTIDYRGLPISTYLGKSNAIDNSPISFWDCSVVSDEPINVPIDSFSGGGAYIKFKIMLPAVYEITEVAITPYCMYPVEICDIRIGDKSILSEPETSIDTVSARSAKIDSDEVTIILRQKNYILSTEKTNEKEEEAIELWNKALKKEKESYVQENRKRSEEEIYANYMQKKEKQISIWNQNLIKDREIGE